MTTESPVAEKSLLEQKSISASKILKMVVLLQLTTHIWSASQSLKGQDLPKVDKDDLPPSHLAKLGNKKLIDVQELNVFHKLKRQASRVLENYGVPFMGGWAIPCAKIEVVAEELNLITNEFDAEREKFLLNYPTLVKDWITKNPSWEAALTAKPVPVEKVALALSMDWLAIDIAEHKGKSRKLLEKSFHKEVDSLSDKLFDEIASTANDILTGSMIGNSSVSQKTMTRIENIRVKLNDLSFLDANVQPLVELIKYIEALMPPNGIIEGESFDVLFALVELLSSTEKSKEFATHILQGATIEDASSMYLLKETKSKADLFGEEPQVEPTVAAAEVHSNVSNQSVSENESTLASVLVNAKPLSALPSDVGQLQPKEIPKPSIVVSSPPSVGAAVNTVPATQASLLDAVEFF